MIVVRVCTLTHNLFAKVAFVIPVLGLAGGNGGLAEIANVVVIGVRTGADALRTTITLVVAVGILAFLAFVTATGKQADQGGNADQT